MQILESGEPSTEGGCGKMALCGSVKQNEVAYFLIFDNREREGALVKSLVHIDQQTVSLPVTRVDNTSFAYKFEYAHGSVGVAILEVFVDGEQIPESPFRIEVNPRDCEEDYPGQGKQAVSIFVRS
jgi:hypothetical protein